MHLDPGTSIDRYTVEALLGQGGMAIVYRVRHNQLGSLHALKLLKISSPTIQARLMQEGRAQASLRHPNIVAVTDIVSFAGATGLIMEYVDGPGLDALLARRRLTLDQADLMAEGILEGVAAAHRLGFVHRDLKPSNVLVQPVGQGFLPKVADFGLVKLLAPEGPGSLNQTRTGMAMGTPRFMSPEQITDAKSVDARADIFSLGAMLYELVCGCPAFTGSHMVEVFVHITSGSFIPPREHVPELPEPMERAILGALEIDRERRIASCEQLLATWKGLPPTDVSHGSGGPWSTTLMQDIEMMTSGGSLAESAPSVGMNTFAGAESFGEASWASGTGAAPSTGLGGSPTFDPDSFGSNLAEQPSVEAEVAAIDPAPLAKEPSGRVVPRRLVVIGALAIAGLAVIAVSKLGGPRAPEAPGPLPPSEVSPLAAEAPTPSAAVPQTQPAVALPTESKPQVPEPATARAVSPRASVPPRSGGETPVPRQTTPPVEASPQAEVTDDAAGDPESATVIIRGDVERVWLQSGEGRFPAGKVPPGTYEVLAFFDGVNPTATATIVLAPGQSRALTCSATLMVCK